MSRRNLLAMPAAALLAIALAPSDAHAWKHTTRVWLPEDMPLRYWVADNGEDGDICVDDPTTTDLNEQFDLNTSRDFERLNCCEETVPGGYCIEATQQGYDAWKAAECAEFETSYEGVINNYGTQTDNRNYVTFNDPNVDIEELGTLAVTFTRSLGEAFVFDGVVYTHSYDSDIVFNDDVQFDTYENIESGQCNGGHDMRSVMTHEIGHLLGMDHSCEEEDLCADPLLANATMFWSIPDCNTVPADINQDDIEGFTALYGPFATFECSHQVSDDLAVGVVPFDLNCVIVSDFISEITGAQWNFGDGGVADGLTPTHTYDEPGNYTIQLTVQGEREACGESGWENNFRKVGYVRACGVPEVEFEVEHVDGLEYQMLNNSDVSVYGCIQDIQWEIRKGNKTTGDTIVPPIKAWEPIIEFPEPGDYTVVAHVGGPAGTGAAVLSFEARNRRGTGRGCDTAMGLGASGGLMLALGGLLVARRRR